MRDLAEAQKEIKEAKERIVVIDDEQRICDSLHALLSESGYEVKVFQDSTEASQEIRSGEFDLIISDIKMPGMSGLDILKLARKVDPQALVVIMTGYASLESAVEAINHGAYDYLLKPVEFPQLELVIKRGLEKRRLGKARAFLLGELQEKNRELNARLNEINALYEAGKSLGSTIELDILLRRIIELATNVLEARIGSIMLLDEAKKHLTIAAAIGLEEEVIRTTKVPIGTSIAGYVAETGQPLFIPDVEKDPRFRRQNREERYGPSSLISVPLLAKDQVIGVINIANKGPGREFGEHDLKLLSTFASQAASAIDNAANFLKLKRSVSELSTLREIADAMSRASSVQNLHDIIFEGIRGLMPAEAVLWFRWQAQAQQLIFIGGAGNVDLDLVLEISTELENLQNPEDSTRLILEHLARVEGRRPPSTTFRTHHVSDDDGLAYIFCLCSSRERGFTEEDLQIAGLIANQAANLYEREKSILNATRLLTMGNMISEISHDMRKPLTNIRGGLQVMRGQWPEISENSDFFRMAEEEVFRLNELVKELVDFSNPNKYETERVNVTRLMTRSKELIQPDLEKKGVICDVDIEENLPELFVNKNQLLEMFLNIYMNAIDAMTDGGTLRLGAHMSTLNGRAAVALTVADTGCGIKKEHLSRIFDRYYTTKESGTGLGLAVVERIVSAHNGKVSVESTENKGTCFTIHLPA